MYGFGLRFKFGSEVLGVVAGVEGIQSNKLEDLGFRV